MPFSITGTIVLPTTLSMAAAAAVINFWLAMRIGKLRMAHKVFMGDGQDTQIYARMRAQANFGENVPIALILIGLVELAGKGGWWLPLVGAAFMLGRVAHAFGMDGRFKAGRPIGMITAWGTHLGLAVVALLASVGRI